MYTRKRGYIEFVRTNESPLGTVRPFKSEFFSQDSFSTTNTHTHRERERERERKTLGEKSEIEESFNL